MTASLPANAQHRVPASRAWTVCAAGLLCVAVFFRVWHLSNVPGVNGDEAFWGIKALHLLRGEPTGWRSNSGNLVNVFYLFPLMGLHAIFAPSVVLLRAVAVISGILLLPVNFVLCRRVFGRMTAALSTVLLAVLPTNIAYSRFGWEPSQSVLADTIVLFLCLRLVQDTSRPWKWGTLSVLAFVCACDVHPTNVFMGPFVAFAILMRVGWPGRLGKRGRAAFYAVCAVFLIALVARMPFVLSNGLDPFAFAQFGVHVLRLFSGATVYRYIAGSVPAVLWCWDALTGLAFALAVGSILRFARRDTNTASADRLLLASGLVGLAGFYAVTGAFAVSPSHERYALWMVPPGALLLARGAALVVRNMPRWRPALLTAGTAAGLAMLVGFDVFYFQFIQTTGGRAHETFRTAATEPKRAALHFVLAHRTGASAFLVASEWWNYQPLYYFAMNTPSVRVLTLEEWNGRLSSQDRKRAVQSGAVWFAEFDDSANAASLRQTLGAAHVPFEQPTVNDFAGRPVLALLHPLPH